MTPKLGERTATNWEYGVAVLAIGAWFVSARWLPIVSQFPGIALVFLFIAAALTLHYRPTLVVVVLGALAIEIIRPAPSLGVHLARGIFVVLVGGGVVTMAYGRLTRFSALQQYALLFQQHPLPMWLVDEDTLAFLTVNGASTSVYGYSEREFLQRTMHQIRSAPELKRWNPAESHGDDQHVTRDGRTIDVFVRSQPVVVDGRRALLVLIEDITERRQLEEQLRQSQKMEAVGRLAGGIAHDFNNLLTAVRGYAALLMEALPEDDPRHADALEIERAGARGSDLTAQLLAFSRKQIMQVHVVSPSRAVEELSPMLTRLVGERITYRTLARARGNIRVDPAQLQQVVVNLVINARDALHEAGDITVETADVMFDEAYLRTHVTAQPGAHVALTVSDNGAGMDAETQSRIFEPFFTTKGSGAGTGLGLAMVYGIVKQSGGHIWVYSEVGRGTTFKVYFPTTVEEADLVVATSKPLVHGPKDATILIVEDESAVRTLMTRVLKHGGYSVLSAGTIAEAQSLLRSRQERVDLVVTDLVLPDGSGRAVAEAAAQLHPTAHVLYMSGYTDDAVVRQGILQAEADFIQKPFSAAALVERVATILAREVI